MDDLKASATSTETAQTIHDVVKKYATSIGMVINSKKCAIQLNGKSELPESLKDIPRLDERTYKYLGFEMMKGEVARKAMMERLEMRISDKLEDPTKRVEVFETRNWIQYVNRNVMSVIRFYSGPVKFTLGWLDRIDKMIRQHLTRQGLLMKRGMSTARLYMSPDDMGIGLKSCTAVYLLELVRLLLQYKWGTIFRQEWFWRMEEITKRNEKGVWLREIEKALKRFNLSLEWLMNSIELREGEIEKIRLNEEVEANAKSRMLRTQRMKSMAEVLEEVEVLIDTHFFNEF